MKPKTPRGTWALRGVTITISVIVIIVIGSVAYSAYEDYQGIRTELVPGSNQAKGVAMVQGSSEVVSINITVPNNGLYVLNVTVTCDSKNPNVVCSPSQVVLPGGQQGVLRFKMTVLNIQQFAASPDHRINGTVAIKMVPFAGLSLGVDLGGFVKTGAG